MAACRVGDAVRVQVCGRFRPTRIVRATTVMPDAADRLARQSQICAAAPGHPRSHIAPLACRRRATPGPDVYSLAGLHLPQFIHSIFGQPQKPVRMWHYFQSVTPWLREVSMVYPAPQPFQLLSQHALILGKLDRTARNIELESCFRDLCTELSTDVVDIAEPARGSRSTPETGNGFFLPDTGPPAPHSSRLSKEGLFSSSPPGWASLMVAVLLLSGVQLMILGIFGDRPQSPFAGMADLAPRPPIRVLSPVEIARWGRSRRGFFEWSPIPQLRSARCRSELAIGLP
jgi:hypothetical protein